MATLVMTRLARRKSPLRGTLLVAMTKNGLHFRHFFSFVHSHAWFCCHRTSLTLSRHALPKLSSHTTPPLPPRTCRAWQCYKCEEVGYGGLKALTHIDSAAKNWDFQVYFRVWPDGLFIWKLTNIFLVGLSVFVGVLFSRLRCRDIR